MTPCRTAHCPRIAYRDGKCRSCWAGWATLRRPVRPAVIGRAQPRPARRDRNDWSDAELVAFFAERERST